MALKGMLPGVRKASW
ncbi:hypothetical protein GBAR_LOCUS26758 [Geodia barretti]|nr:hypothetical protein GBAR_LOCUS26758 [Geodia barretti]